MLNARPAVLFDLSMGNNIVAGSEMADGLVEKSTCLTLSPSWKSLVMTLSNCKLIVGECLVVDEYCRIIVTTSLKKRSRKLVSQKTKELSMVMDLLTGHLLLSRYAERLTISSNGFCRSGREEAEPETLRHFLWECPALQRSRLKSVGGLATTSGDMSEVAGAELN